MSTLAILVLVVSLISNFAGFPQLPGITGEQSAAHLSMHVIAAAAILLIVTSLTHPQAR
jgi:hypothetical protein